MKHYSLLILLFVGLLSCEKEIPLTIEESQPRIVLNSIFKDGDTCWINLSESRTALYEGELPNITNANATFHNENGDILGNFVHKENGNYYLAEPFPVLGNTYQVKVNSGDFTPISAMSFVPSKISILKTDTTSAVPNQQMRFNIQFKDDPSQTNFYAVSIETHRTYTNPEFPESNYSYVDYWFTTNEFFVLNGSNDIDGTNYAQEFYFNDESLNGSIIDFQCETYYPQNESDSLFYVVKVSSLSEELLKYKISFDKYVNSTSDFFAEPVQVYSNVTNGFGILGGYSAATDTIRPN